MCIARIGVITLALLVAACFAKADEKRGRGPEQELRKMESRAHRMASAANDDQPGQFLMRETNRLIERTRSVRAGSYEFERLIEALDDLLDAREELADASRGVRDRSKQERKQAATAKRLERAYFRAQQADYFARLAGADEASEYVLRARQLYQQARAAWDRGEYYRAEKLASASTEVVNVIENLAQAAVRRPDPPVLK